MLHRNVDHHSRHYLQHHAAVAARLADTITRLNQTPHITGETQHDLQMHHHHHDVPQVADRIARYRSHNESYRHRYFICTLLVG